MLYVIVILFFLFLVLYVIASSPRGGMITDFSYCILLVATKIGLIIQKRKEMARKMADGKGNGEITPDDEGGKVKDEWRLFFSCLL